MRRPTALMPVALVGLATLLTACGSTVQQAGGQLAGGATEGLQAAAPGVAGSTTDGLAVDGLAPGTSSAGSITTGGAAGTGSAAGAPGEAAQSGTSASAPAPGSGVAGQASTIPATGRGWDEKTITIGVVTNTDVSQIANSIGVDTLDSGDQKADAEAMIADINSRGGVYGRKLKGLFLDVKTTTGGEANSQASCAFFTEDNAVVAVVNGALQNDTPSFRACMLKARVPVLAFASQPLDEKVFQEHQGYYSLMVFPSWNRIAVKLVERLKAQDYFSAWDTGRGAPGTAPVKIGLIHADGAIAKRSADAVAAELKKAGHPVASTFAYQSLEQLQSAVLRFRADGITHVVDVDQFLFYFATQAESQSYRPRYALTTPNLPALLMQGTVPPAQLAGSVGTGFGPTFDVDAARDPGAVVPSAEACRKTLQRHGVTYPPNKRFALAYAYLHCDAFRLLSASMNAGGGLDDRSILAGMAKIGSTVPPAFTFTNGFRAGVNTWPGASLDVFWDAPCVCMKYRGSISPL